MKKGYSSYLKPISIFIDLFVLNATMFVLTNAIYMELVPVVFFNATWLLIAINTKLYVLYRYTKYPKVVTRLVLQFIYYSISYFAYFGLFKEGDVFENQKITLMIVFGVIFVLKLLYVFVLRKYRLGGGNFRNVVIIGGS
ncbi:MAG: undecaprenyl-phosphate glucose phosphotransferase, partial [Flavobacteriaceae bacterium]|nr:undecaprenyl-phosphate glucose phosphotransferase [Flavobacteriaceae bacterium]